MGGEENVVVAYYCQQYAMEKMLELRNKVLLASRRVSGAFPHYDISFLAHSAVGPVGPNGLSLRLNGAARGDEGHDSEVNTGEPRIQPVPRERESRSCRAC